VISLEARRALLLPTAGDPGRALARAARRLATASALFFVVPLLAYLATAWVLVFQQHLIVGDALSRVGSASYMLFSRDPHLGAIGFVWGPLPTLLMTPFVILGRLWPPLVTDGFAASIVSALAMALAVQQLLGILRDWGLGRRLAWTVTAAFALHPMTVQYGANGDSEALFILLLFVTVRQLSRWFETRDLLKLVFVGVALALAYLTRYETVAVAAAVVGLVWMQTFHVTAGLRSARARAGIADAVIVGVPFVAAFVFWALASWIIVGDPFEQFTSIYGTSAQIAAAAPAALTLSQRFAIVVGQLVGLEPFALLAVALAAIAMLRRPDMRILTVGGIFGGVLGFSALAFLSNHTNGWLRYEITVIPLTTLLVGAWLATLQPASATSEGRPRLVALSRRLSLGRSRTVVGLATCVLLLAAVPTTLAVMTDPVVGREDHYGGFEQPRYVVARETADYLDGLDLPEGSVLVDTFLGFPIVLDSARPKQFVVTSDRDFLQSVEDPIGFGRRYVLIPEGSGLAGLDAIERRWPTIYGTGAGLGTLVREFGIDGSSFRWRLYALKTS
jgi:hypothetical protein